MELLGRIRDNVRFYYLQYLIVTGICFALMLFFSPGAWVELLIIGAVWVVLLFATRDQGERVKTVVLGAMGIGSAVALFFVLEGVFWWGIGASAILVLGHAIYNDPSKLREQEQQAGNVELENQEAPKTSDVV
ncbi:expressed unknown protein [Seminavis robusta]|uniref:PRA1 family protein n=1 Tax=Seminavis robusta TaxID=568900 RepID=A0A9N8E6U9_9STRA|nr:expressed unknown protein [Seminavis robusta]|eukprot:Sro685_g186910.1 n/a (133) ;mRNA; f:26324-26833